MECMISRIDISAPIYRRDIDLGQDSTDVDGLGCATLSVAEFIFQVRSVSMTAMRPEDLTWLEDTLTVLFRRCKGQSVMVRRRQLMIQYMDSPLSCSPYVPLSLIGHWKLLRPSPESLFQVGAADPSLAGAVVSFVLIFDIQTPPGCYFGYHSSSIRGFN